MLAVGPKKTRARKEPPLAFSSEDYERATGATCGPLSLAAGCGKTLQQIEEQVGFPRYMNPADIAAALRRFGIRFNHRKAKDGEPKPELQQLRNGIAFVQWIGPWLDPRQHRKAAYRHTHWIASRNRWVFDPEIGYGWHDESEWRSLMDEYAREDDEGWYIREWYEFQIQRPRLRKARPGCPAQAAFNTVDTTLGGRTSRTSQSEAMITTSIRFPAKGPV